MRLRPYISTKDYEYIKKWVDDERVHALWCANLIPYPLSAIALKECLDKNATDWGDCAYVVTEDSGKPIGFFLYSVNYKEDSGFLKFVILDRELRGKGYGTEMLKLVLKYAFEITGVSTVRLNVFDVNENAKKCYMNAGFKEEGYVKDVFQYKDNYWGRCHMVVSKNCLI